MAEDDYNFSHPRRGVCVIFNNMQFDAQTQQTPRVGSEQDAANLKKTFEELGFEVKLYENSSAYDMYSTLLSEAGCDHSDEDCFACVILSHGDRDIFLQDGQSVMGDVVFGRDQTIILKDLTDLLSDENAPTLAGKPKIFITQMCRGNRLCAKVEYRELVYESGERYIIPGPRQDNYMNLDYDEPDYYDLPPNTFPQDPPIHKDFLLVCSTPPGFFSFRNRRVGSVFVNALCDKLKELHVHKDLLSILTRVNHQVAYEFMSNAPSTLGLHEKKQMPWVASKLLKCVHFKPK